jgi:hypothetical protein
MQREEGIMANQIKVSEVVRKSGRRTHTAAQNGGERWRPADAARFFFKGQCYDAGPESDSTCSICGEHIRLVYVLRVIESPSNSYAQEVGKLVVGECCFTPIEPVNQKLYLQLLAAAVNLRTYIEAIKRDQGIFADPRATAPSDKVELPRLELSGTEEDLTRQLFEALVNDGGDHA